MNCVYMNRTERMATRMNMMKLLQEARGLAELNHRGPYSRPPGPLMLQLRPTNRKPLPPKRKRALRIDMQDPPDIPQPVRITFRNANPPPASAL